jgi:uncharacterized membrane protein SpoIIM required for sporulation
MLFVAGIIEAFLSPSDIPRALKYLFAAVMFTLLMTYLNFSRRPQPDQA